jgi:hypothetical protein
MGLFWMPAGWAAEPAPSAERRVMAFYYPWYGTADGPGGAGRTVHWGRIDADRKEISESTHYPLGGAYDSHSEAVAERHCREAKESGIDTLIISWWGAGSYEDRSMPRLLDACERNGLKATVYYETVPSPQRPQTAAADLLVNLLNRYGSHPAWLRHRGKPVVFVYGRAVEEIGLLGWHQVKETIERDYPGGAVLIGDGLSYGTAAVFDGIHTYNPAGELKGKTPDQVRRWCSRMVPQWIETARRQGKIAAVTVIPGYDDTKIRTPGLRVERFEGQLYAAQWQAAAEAAPDWILITSFNEWHEGSEIEPSVEYGASYLALTAHFSRLFRETLSVPKPLEAAVPASLDKRLREALSGETIAVLPEPSSTAFWWLLNRKPDLKILSWEEVISGALSPSSYSMVLFAGGETYRRTVQKEGDVPAALEAYLRAGGVLVVLPSQPWPFYYDEQGRFVNDAARFGVSLKGGWEQPPEGTELFFVPSSELLELSEPIPFPPSGDRRWRPFVPGTRHVRYRPLLVLKDRRAGTYGDGLVISEIRGGGKVVYGWFGLFHDWRAEMILTELFLALARNA